MVNGPMARHTPNNLPKLPAVEKRSLEIDLELRDVWELLDASDLANDLQHLAVAANMMRVAYDRGLRHGQAEGFLAGQIAGRAAAADEAQPNDGNALVQSTS